MCESCNKYANDYKRIVELAKKQANIEKVEYWVYQKENKSYGYNKSEFIPEDRPIQYKAIPVD